MKVRTIQMVKENRVLVVNENEKAKFEKLGYAAQGKAKKGSAQAGKKQEDAGKEIGGAAQRPKQTGAV